MQPLSLIPYHISPTTLGLSFAFCFVISYTLVKMVGTRFSNQFPVEGRVRLQRLNSTATLLTRSSQTVIITGGSDGMGKAVACQLAEKGANVVIVARTVKKLEDSLVGLKVRLPCTLPPYD